MPTLAAASLGLYYRQSRRRSRGLLAGPAILLALSMASGAAIGAAIALALRLMA